MSGMRKVRHDPATQEPRRAPLDFAQGSLVYTRQPHRRRNRRYLFIAALLIFGVGIGEFAVLLTNWLDFAK
jgi:hypothetical protein